MKKLSHWAAVAYGWVVRLWRWSYRAFPFRVKKVPARVVSVGNVTWGGTGKTPVVIRLAQALAERDRKVAVLTRGYGRDEVEEMRRELGEIPVFVGRDRVKNARRAIREAGAEVLILDDGFQHLALHRDVDLVTLNATVPFGPGGLIPEGTLREPLANLARANGFILTHANIGSKNLHWIRQKLQSVKPDAVVFEEIHRPLQIVDPASGRSQDPGWLARRRVATICGIGDPHSFEKSVEWLGAEIALAARFADHHNFTAREISEFLRRVRVLGLRDVVTTEKDDVRLRPVLARAVPSGNPATFWVFRVEAEIHGEEDLIRRCLDS